MHQEIRRKSLLIGQDIQLCGPYILNEHCLFENCGGVVTMAPAPDALCYVNGRAVLEPLVLRTGNRVILGKVGLD